MIPQWLSRREARLDCLAMGVMLAVQACSSPRLVQDRRARADSSQTGTVPGTGVNQRLLLAAAGVALPPPGVTPAALPEPQSEGAAGVVKYCAPCHNLPTPTIHSATDWPSVVRRMWLRADRLPSEFGVVAPTADERQVILNYLIRDALVVSGSALPAGAGRSTFSKACSRCHALPDPRQHSPTDWPSVVARMQQRMDQMNVDQPPREALREILAYLDQASAFPADSARKIVRARVPHGTIIQQELSCESGKPVFSFSVREPGKPGSQLISIDGVTGAVLEIKPEGTGTTQQERTR